MALALRVFAILLCCALGSAHAADKPGNGTKRVALVIGNGNYQGSLPKLGNPAHDAEDIAKALRGFGFEVIERTNQGLEGMNNAIAEFSRKAGNSEAALFYFAGHGLQVKGQNYLIPVDANIETEARVQYVSVNVNQVLDEMDNAKSRVNIVMLDACRNNPISGKFRSGATRGLAPVTSQPKGTVIVYATDPGNVASDGEGRNGLFTAGVLTAFKGGDLSLHGVLLRASAEVERGSGQTQTPYINGPATLQQSFRFAAGTQVAQLGGGIGGLTSSRTPQQIEDELWDTIKDNDRPSVFEEYIKGYPKGRYVTQAKVKIVALKETVKPVAPPAPASVQTVYASDPETALWNEVQKGNAADDYDVYMKQYPKGKFVALAKQRLQKLKDEARQQAEAAEQSAWQAAEGAQTPEGYAAYLASHPNGRYAALAQTRASKLRADAAVQEESRLWQVAEKGGKAEVDAYLSRYSDGRYASAANLRLAEIKKEEGEMRPGKTFKDCADCPEMVILPAGTFDMGSPASESGRFDNEGPQHRVSVKSFAAGKYEITRGQFAAFVNASGHNAGSECYTFEGGKYEKRGGRNWQNPGYAQNDTHPVVCVSWGDARAYAAWLSSKTGKSYRLLSEAEWEFAARAGTTTARYWGESPDQACGYANVMDATGKSQVPGVTWEAHNCSDGHAYTASAGSFKSNAFGLHDMIGNAWEWTEDCWNKNYAGAPSDGSAWTTGECSVWRVQRGGSWLNEPRDARSAKRLEVGKPLRGDLNGFRLARMLPSK